MNEHPWKLTDEDTNRIVAEIRNQFLSGAPIKHLEIPLLLEFIASHQEKLLSCTITHALNKKYPLKRSHQLSFLKSVICMLESSGVEVTENIYVEYMKLLNMNDSSDFHHVHFRTNNHFISIKEKTSFISNGTTGLAVWQAGRILAQYCTNNAETFRNKFVLELGCGVGLTGLATVMECQPSHYCFTDVHIEVLNYAMDNIKINLGPKLVTEFEECESKLLYRGSYSDTTISVIKLPWETDDFSVVHKALDPDYILAADVVYDSSIFRPLSSTLSRLLKTRSKSTAVLSCTVRNISTLQEFFECLHEYKLEETFVTSVETWDSSYNQKCEVRIFIVHHAAGKSLLFSE